jgi:hypothetical protein
MCQRIQNLVTRRDMLSRAMLGFGGIALTDLLVRQSFAGTLSNLSARSPLFTPKAKRVIYIFLDGGISQIDWYDYKPLLQRDDGKPLPASIHKPKFPFAKTGELLKSPFNWKQWGQNGTWGSNLFPSVNELVDELCLIKSLYHENEDHFTAKNMIFTGSGRDVRPQLGSWLVYGLGTRNQNLPGFIEIMPGVPKSTSSAFLPAQFGGTAIGRPDEKAQDRQWDNIGKVASPEQGRLNLIEKLNHAHEQHIGHERALDAEIQNMELAFRMQTEAPDIMSLEGESQATMRLYGIGEPKTDDFGRACLLARRFAERGVRYITLMHSTRAFGNLWDQHKDLYEGHRGNAAAVDIPIAGLLRDLKSRGMFDDTLVMCGSEFGRTPVFEYQNGAEGRLRNGRDHNPHGFTMWFSGAGLKKGYSHGATDDYGYYAVQDPVSVHDLHATILHLMGIDHTKLTYRHAGRDYRLTDVYGEVVRQVLA